MGQSTANDDRPTLLILGRGEPMQAALSASLARHATSVEAAASDRPVPTVLAAAPDLVLLVGDAAGPKADKILRELAANPGTAVVPVAVVASDLGKRFDLARHGSVAIVPRSASVDAMAKRIAEIARTPERAGEIKGELGEASVDEILSILSREVKAGILSVSQAGDESRAARFVLRSGRPVQEAIRQFVDRLRPLVKEAKPLRFEFHEAPAGRLEILDADAEEGDRNVLRGRRIVLVERNPAAADALAQELRAHDAQVVVSDGEGAGYDRAVALDPELILIEREGLEGWGFPVMTRFRHDPQLRWASVLVFRQAELFVEGQAPRMDRLAAAIEPLLRPDTELRARANQKAPLSARLEATGPTRLLRTLLSTGRTLHLVARGRKAVVELDLAEGLVAGAEATRLDDASGRIGGARALATFLAFDSARVQAEEQEHPAVANLLAPIDDALAAARKEAPLISPTEAAVSEPPISISMTSLSMAPPPAAAAGEAAVVQELRGLVKELKQTLRASIPPSAEDGPTTSFEPVIPPAAPVPRVPAPPPLRRGAKAGPIVPPRAGAVPKPAVPVGVPVPDNVSSPGIEVAAVSIEPPANLEGEERPSLVSFGAQTGSTLQGIPAAAPIGGGAAIDPRTLRIALLGAIGLGSVALVILLAMLIFGGDDDERPELAVAAPAVHEAPAAPAAPSPTPPSAAPTAERPSMPVGAPTPSAAPPQETGGEEDGEDAETESPTAAPDVQPGPPFDGASRAEQLEFFIASGNFLRGRRLYPAAEQRYLSALRLSPRNARALTGLAVMFIDKRDATRAVTYARRLVNSRPRNAGAWVLLGDALVLKGDRAGARRAWMKAFELDPSHEVARQRLGRRR